MKWKPDWEQARENLTKWWRREGPALFLTAPRREPVRAPRGPRDGVGPEPRFVATQTEAGNERSTRKGVRGASWSASHPDLARRARRGAENPRHFYDAVGFRCALSWEGAP